jgi:hypothetical protein
MLVQDITNAFFKASNESLSQTASLLPNLIIAIVVFVIGVFLASLAKKLGFPSTELLKP